MSESVIKTESIFLRRNNVSILQGIDWLINKNENWVLIGTNGSGKTSLLRAAIGDFWPTTGSVYLFGNKLGNCDLPTLKKKIGWVGAIIDKWLPMHETSLRITVSGLHSTYELYKEPTDLQLNQAEDILKNLGCSKILNHHFGKLSQGEKQKVRLARALINKPELLILDEVCAGLDITSREDLLESISMMKLNNLIFVTHHTDEIPPEVTHAAILQEGKILKQGTKKETITTENMSHAYGINIVVEFDNNQRIWTKVIK